MDIKSVGKGFNIEVLIHGEKLHKTGETKSCTTKKAHIKTWWIKMCKGEQVNPDGHS